LKKSFYINGKINKETRDQFKLFLKKVSQNETVYVRIRSWGGNSGHGRFMEGYIYAMKKYKKCTFVMEGEIAASTAFRIFIRGDERIITKRSIIQPHLPVPNILDMDPEKIVIEHKKDLDFITTTIPALTRRDVIEYNDLRLPVKMMQEKKVVTKVVSSF
jgi:ATP-dependent protease ClpP protease subunit